MFSQSRGEPHNEFIEILGWKRDNRFSHHSYYLVQHDYFGTMRAFHKFRYDFPSGGTRNPQLVLRAFHNIVSSAEGYSPLSLSRMSFSLRLHPFGARVLSVVCTFQKEVGHSRAQITHTSTYSLT